MDKKGLLFTTLSKFGVAVDENKINVALSYFRASYASRNYQYVGDEEFYGLLQACLLDNNNLDIDMAVSLSIEVIKREFALHDLYRRIGKPYVENFRPDPLDIAVDQISLSSNSEIKPNKYDGFSNGLLVLAPVIIFALIALVECVAFIADNSFVLPSFFIYTQFLLGAYIATITAVLIYIKNSNS